MKYQLTVGGLNGPTTRAEACDALKMFYALYGCEPAGMTVTVAGWEGMRAWVRDEHPSGLNIDERLHAGEAVKFLGMTLELGIAFTLTA